MRPAHSTVTGACFGDTRLLGGGLTCGRAGPHSEELASKRDRLSLLAAMPERSSADCWVIIC